MIVVIIWTYLAFFIGKYAEYKGKKFGYYFLLSFLTTPLIGFIVLLITNWNKDEGEKRTIETGKKVNKNDFTKDFIKLNLWILLIYLFLFFVLVLLIIYFFKNFGESIMI
tara:strand:- start:159 stop:488 length:330 start_codon:yes stop_codon:yes gene_type:complete